MIETDSSNPAQGHQADTKPTPAESIKEQLHQDAQEEVPVPQVITLDDFERAKMEQRLFPALIGGLVVGIVCAVLWAGISILTQYQIGWMAVGVGLAVGFTVKKIGRGVTPTFGIIGALIALFSCLLGNALTMIGFAYIEYGIAVSELLAEVNIVDLMVETFEVMDLLFYGIAVYEGFRFSFRKLVVA